MLRKDSSVTGQVFIESAVIPSNFVKADKCNVAVEAVISVEICIEKDIENDLIILDVTRSLALKEIKVLFLLQLKQLLRWKKMRTKTGLKKFWFQLKVNDPVKSKAPGNYQKWD